jgi:HTH-type transcriptional regulator / antitoxin HigA
MLQTSQPNDGITMTISPIKTKRDYDRTLRRIEQLMDAKPGTKSGDELDVLTTLVEAYEAKHYAICPPDPSKPSNSVWISSA